jgi:hypothetical protein
MVETNREFDEGHDVQPSAEELRSAPRFTLLIRSAKLVCEGREYLCVIRDVSASGLRLRIFHPLPQVTHFELELATGDRFPLERVWESPDHAGFRFADWIDVKDFIAEASPYPKRALRLKLDFPATITADGAAAHASVRDLSREGARIETTLPLAIRQKVLAVAKRVRPSVPTGLQLRGTGQDRRAASAVHRGDDRSADHPDRKQRAPLRLITAPAPYRSPRAACPGSRA